jgi:hypothetical protein
MTVRGSAVLAWSALGPLAASAPLLIGCSGGSPAILSSIDEADGATVVSPGTVDESGMGSIEDATVADGRADQNLADGTGGHESGFIDAMQFISTIEASGVVDARPDSHVPDAGRPKDAAIDAPNGIGDGSVLDAERHNDGAIDAPTGVGDGRGPTWCAALSRRPLFCADFDEGAIAPAWTAVHTTGGSIALDATEFQSPPDGLIVDTAVVASAKPMVDVAAYRSFAVTGRATFVGMLDLDFRVDRADAPGGVAVLAQLGLVDGGGAAYLLQVVATSNGSSPLSIGVSELATRTGKVVAHPLQQSVALKTWTHVTVSLTAPFGGGAGTAAFGLDGILVERIAVSVPVQNRTQTIGVGITYASAPSTGWTAIFDNVTFDTMSN